jgi:hypothetical protein
LWDRLLTLILSYTLIYEAPIAVSVISGLLLIVNFVPLLLFKHQPLPDVNPPPFKTPLVPVVPCLGILINVWFIVELPVSALVRVFIWATIGFVIYFTYGIRHSALIMQKEVLNAQDS